MNYPVARAFDAIAHRYDVLVALSPGYHRQLAGSARALARRVRDRVPTAATIPAAPAAPAAAGPAGEADAATDLAPDVPLVLDLGCGSGASTRALCRAFGLDRAGGTRGIPVRILGVDASRGMVDQALAKAWPAGVTFRHARAEELPTLEQARDADGVFAAYLLRNVPDRAAVLRDMHDTLRPGGTLVLHDYFRPATALGRAAWSTLAWVVIIPLSAVVTRRPGLFVYLWRSVRDFETVDAVERALTQAGFIDVSSRPARGWESFVVHTVTGHRP